MGDRIYRNLRKHLNQLPIGFPRTISGVEIRILKYLFTPREAQIAMILSPELRELPLIFSNIPLEILNRLNIKEKSQLSREFDELAKKGLIYKVGDNGITKYANAPLVIGMFEFNLHNLSLPFLKDIEKYIKQGFGVELINSQVPQLRTIPIEQSLKPLQFTVPYDNLRDVIKNTDEIITVANCICRESYDIDKRPCSHTKLRETCINIGEMGQRYLDIGIGREISKQEAIEIIEQAEEDGLVLQSMNAQTPLVICACCGDCCGTLSILKALPRPRDFSSSNYICSINVEKCTKCGMCIESCHMDALKFKKGQIFLKEARCIGCGVCVSKCKSSALSLQPVKGAPKYTPHNRLELYESINQNKKARWGKIKMLLKIITRREMKDPNPSI